MQTYRASIPQRSALDFIHKPKPAAAASLDASRDGDDEAEGEHAAPHAAPHMTAKAAAKTATGARFEQHFKNLTRNGSASNPRAEKISIEGRGLHM